MRRSRRILLGAILGAAAVACGLSVTGIDPEEAAGTDGGDESRRVDPRIDSAVADSQPTDARPLDASPACDAGAALCDFCRSDLVLCLDFANGVVDRSSFARAIDRDGGLPALVADSVGRTTLSLDGSVVFTAPAGAAILEHEQLTFEMYARLREPPPDGGRYGLFDRNGTASMFVYASGVADGGTYLRCHGIDTPPTTYPTNRYVHVACTFDGRADRLGIFLDGQPLVGADGGSVAREADASLPLYLFANDPTPDAAGFDGLDPFQGDVAWLRIWSSVRTRQELSEAAEAGR